MKVIYNDVLPPKGFKAINLFGVVLVRRGFTMTDKDLRHEAIHSRQMREMAYVLFYLWYVVEWLVRLPCGGNAYRKISFEREAYSHDWDDGYLKKRKAWAWWKYLR